MPPYLNKAISCNCNLRNALIIIHELVNDSVAQRNTPQHSDAMLLLLQQHNRQIEVQQQQQHSPPGQLQLYQHKTN